MRTPIKLAAVAAALLLPLASQASAVTTVKPGLTHLTRTSDWGKPSPDPMGLAYRPSSNTIFVVDSEVEETALWGGVNLWEMSRSGSVVGQGSTTKFSVEPTDIAYSPKSKRFFVADDDLDRIFVVATGADNKMGTPDDRVRSFSTAAFGSRDAEGLGFGAGTLWITDGVGQQVFKVKPGANKTFDGIAPEGDDTITHFSTAGLGLNDPEDVEYNRVNNHLYIVSRVDKIIAETSPIGALRKVYDLTDSNINQPAGITLAPSTNGTGKALFVADRGYDNELHPNENDGRIFEFKRTA